MFIVIVCLGLSWSKVLQPLASQMYFECIVAAFRFQHCCLTNVAFNSQLSVATGATHTAIIIVIVISCLLHGAPGIHHLLHHPAGCGVPGSIRFLGLASPCAQHPTTTAYTCKPTRTPT